MQIQYPIIYSTHASSSRRSRPRALNRPALNGWGPSQAHETGGVRVKHMRRVGMVPQSKKDQQSMSRIHDNGKKQKGVWGATAFQTSPFH
ncbi:uncharacterized protein H6S33_001019 [Morchella sextelata]|uniref:uncharacterized protein n=1 Tax=Morchella sextelata TaxID=1174677 RepID=UPI001D053174|nr:uncharacterized protein H6S33_001019 [Morchella sextelata]KAH0608791.1 hypothetical protein H6S33_001019 [Morchella sextelata]